MGTLEWIIMLGAADLIGRAAALLYLMGHNAVRGLQYRTWVLLCAFVNFAWIFYALLGRQKAE